MIMTDGDDPHHCHHKDHHGRHHHHHHHHHHHYNGMVQQLSARIHEIGDEAQSVRRAYSNPERCVDRMLGLDKGLSCLKVFGTSRSLGHDLYTSKLI